MLPAPSIIRNDSRARVLILTFSFIVFAAIVLLSRYKLNVSLGFNVHLFATANAVINSCVTVLLITAYIAVRRMRYELHKKLMLIAMALSVLFLVSYICHHLFAGETRFGDLNHDGVMSESEKTVAGSARIIYYILLGTHIPLAGIILPFILFTAYRSLTGEYEKHKKLARITLPIWLYVAITGVIVYLMISPYYN
jgi:putative membrane protein